ncbi:uncharacterized protein LOC143429282 [Xylocopa sonorina]|uniref:uncharacterized protein LOC143429282 n=1 Tax=Xylocopa sonorina TaxID=1818115 RepID=UPI00403AE1CE
MANKTVDDPPRNDRYENDIRYAFQLCHRVLKLIGIYPFIYVHANRSERITSVALILLCCCILQFVNVPFSYYFLFYEKDINVKIKLLGPLIFCLTTFLRYGYLGAKCSAITRCIEHVERDWKVLRDEDHRGIMIRYVNMSRNLLVMCVLFMYSGGLSYHTIMPLLSKQVSENFTIRPLTYPGYEAFLNVQESPTYEIVYCMHCVYVLVTGNIALAAYGLTAIFTTHACGQIQIQAFRLEKLRGEKKVYEQALKDCLALVVKDHVEILRFTRNVDKALGELFLMEVAVSTLLMCLLEYYCMMEWQTSDSIAIITYVILLISFTFNILIFCVVGELLLGQVNEIADASYGTEWYNLSGNRARDIVLLLAMSKRPPKLMAGKVLVLSFTTFGNVLKTSIVYLNMLRTVTEFYTRQTLQSNWVFTPRCSAREVEKQISSTLRTRHGLIILPPVSNFKAANFSSHEVCYSRNMFIVQSSNFVDTITILLNQIKHTMNNNYQSDVDSSLRYYRMFLKIIGVWPLINGYTNKMENLISMLLIAVCVTSMLLVLVPAGYNFFYIKEMNSKVLLLGPVCYFTACVLKYCCLILKASTFKHCIKLIEKDWKLLENEEYRSIMIDYVIIAHKLTVIFSSPIYFIGMSYTIVSPFWSNPYHMSDNSTIRPLVYPGLNLFIDVSDAFKYELIHTMHCIYAFISVTIESVFVALVVSFVAHACGMFQIQMTRLEYLVDRTKDKDEKGEDLLAVIVYGHVETLRYTKSISKALQELYFFNILSTTIVICALGFLFIVAKKNNDIVGICAYIGAWISLSFNMFVMCYAGERLLEQGAKFGDATYNIKWYNLPQKRELDLVLLIAIAKFPPKLTGGKIFEISVNTFGTVIKSSFVYLNLCQAITE